MTNLTPTYKVNLKLDANKAFLKHLESAIAIDYERTFQIHYRNMHRDDYKPTIMNALQELDKDLSAYWSIRRQIRSQLECFVN